jgi:uncharacterized protein (DUF1501 family)
MKAPAQITRRDFLSTGAAFVAASQLGSGLRLTTDGFITFINMVGGNDALNTLVPTRLQAYGLQRSGIAITPTAGLPLDTGPFANLDYVLHPAMPRLASLYRQGFVAFVRMAGYAGANMSHNICQDVWSRGGVTPTQPDSGWIARYKDLYAQEPINVVALGLGQQLDFRGGTTPSTFSVIPPDPSTIPAYTFIGDTPFRANDRLRFQVAEQVALRARPAGLPERARIAQLAMYEQFRDLRANPPVLPPEYPATSLGSVLSSSAEMLREALPVKIFYALAGTAQDFDTHYEQGGVSGQHAAALGRVDAALTAYVADLQQMGAWNRAVIVLFSEFGRRNAASNNGTDHGTGGLMIMIGGAVRGGMFGPDLTEEAVNAFTLPVMVDFRTVYEELLARHLEVDPTPVFTETYSRQPPLGVIL